VTRIGHKLGRTHQSAGGGVSVVGIERLRLDERMAEAVELIPVAFEPWLNRFTGNLEHQEPPEWPVPGRVSNSSGLESGRIGAIHPKRKSRCSA
jgi:hypothetical protein